jgi:hypothetical protein
MPTLDEALDTYHDGIADRGERNLYGRETLKPILASSPVLKANIELALARGDINGFTFGQADLDGAGGSYDTRTGTIDIPSASFTRSAAMVFVLGHETQHALSLRGQAEQPYVTRLKADIDGVQAAHIPPRLDPADPDPRVQPSPHGAPRDYTTAVARYVEGVRGEEAQAHIGGFNALVSFASRQKGGGVPTPQELYETLPERMGDFITRRGTAPNLTYEMKPGLTRATDGTLAFTPENVDAMKRHYADKFPGSFGDNGLLDYRHQSIQTAWKLIQHSEADITRVSSQDHQRDFYTRRTPDYVPVDNAYKIDFAALGANPAVMRYPPDGVLRTVDTFAGHKALDDAGARADDPRRDRIDDSVDLTRDAIRGREQASRLLREQGLLPSSGMQRVSDLAYSVFGSRNPDDPVPNVARAPMQLPQAPAQDPDLLVQARTALGTMSGTGVLGDRVRFENVAAAMALQAHRDGLQQIDQVVTGPLPGRVFAVQGQDPAAPESRHATIDLAQAAARPAQDSLRDLQQALQPAPAPVLALQGPVQDQVQGPPPQGQGVAQDPPQGHAKPHTV